jgi:hypothetical protein
MTEVESKSPAPPVGDPQSNPEQSSDTNAEPDSSQFPPQGPSGQPFPPPHFAFYNYPPNHQGQPGDGSNPDPNAPPNANGAGSVPYPPPPGMMYPYAYPQPPPGTPLLSCDSQPMSTVLTVRPRLYAGPNVWNASSRGAHKTETQTSENGGEADKCQLACAY